MGVSKYDKTQQMMILEKAHQMAEAFAVNKTPEFLERFIKEAGLTETPQMKEDFNIPFGGALALAYAMGFADAKMGRSLKVLYGQKEDDGQMELPGFKVADAGSRPTELIGETTPEHLAMINAQPRIITDTTK